MRGVIFFLFLCFLLLKGYGYVHASVRDHMAGYTAVQAIEKINRLKFTKPGQSYILVEDNGPHQQMECFYGEDMEDEGDDDDDGSAKKHTWLTRDHISAYDPFILHYYHNCSIDRLDFTGHLSDKYILQRTLRI